MNEPNLPTEKEKLAVATGRTPELTDTDRINALLTMFGGHYAFHIGFSMQSVMRDGRRGIDALIAANPTLLGK